MIGANTLFSLSLISDIRSKMEKAEHPGDLEDLIR